MPGAHVWPMTELLASNRQRATDASSAPNSHSRWAGPSCERLVATAARIDQEQVGHCAEIHLAEDTVGIGRVGQPMGQPLRARLEGRGAAHGPRPIPFGLVLVGAATPGSVGEL